MLSERNVCEVWLRVELKKWPSHLLVNLSVSHTCTEKFFFFFLVSSTGFQPMTSAILVQCSHLQSCEATQMWAGQFVGLVFPWKEYDWKKVHMRHLLRLSSKSEDHFFNNNIFIHSFMFFSSFTFDFLSLWQALTENYDFYY